MFYKVFSLLLYFIVISKLNGQDYRPGDVYDAYNVTGITNVTDLILKLAAVDAFLWKENITPNSAAVVSIPVSQGTIVRNVLNSSLLTYTPISYDLIQGTRPNGAPSTNPSSYLTYTEQSNYMTSLASLGTRQISLGVSEGNAQILGLEIGQQGRLSNMVVLIVCNLEAFQWLTSAACLQLIDTLQQSRPEYVDLKNRFTFVIFPNMNPDGYRHTFTTDRLWEKNRKAISVACQGVHLDRNFVTEWGMGKEVGSFPCGQRYKGPNATSENEIQLLLTFVANSQAQGKQFYAFFNVAGWGQQWLLPDRSYARNVQKIPLLSAFANAGVNGVRRATNQHYELDSFWLRNDYGGNAADYFHDQLSVNLATTIKLRPGDREEFYKYAVFYPERKINETAQELLSGIIHSLAFTVAINENKGDTFTFLPGPATPLPSTTAAPNVTTTRSSEYTSSSIIILWSSLIVIAAVVSFLIYIFYDVTADCTKRAEIIDAEDHYVSSDDEVSELEVLNTDYSEAYSHLEQGQDEELYLDDQDEADENRPSPQLQNEPEAV